jgi:ferredoxin
MSEKISITLKINGAEHAIAVEPRRTLVDAIREDCGQTGTHIGCEHGICGACTVSLDGEPVRSCLMFAVQAQRDIRTVEGLASRAKFRSSFLTLAAELPTLSTARSSTLRVTPKCLVQYLTSFSLTIVILLRSGRTLFVRLRRTNSSIVRIQLAAFHDGP